MHFLFCNFRFELHFSIFSFFVKQIVLKSDFFLKKKPAPSPLWKCLDLPLYPTKCCLKLQGNHILQKKDQNCHGKEADTDIYIKGRGQVFFLEKNLISKQFVLQKMKRY
jgi:hypothetical protein